MQPPPSDAEIVVQLLETEGVSDDDHDDYSGEVADEPVNCPDKNELLQVIETWQRFSLFLDKGTQSNLTLVALKIKSISTLLRRRRSKRPLRTF